jgi:hypothetical protein
MRSSDEVPSLFPRFGSSAESALLFSLIPRCLGGVGVCGGRSQLHKTQEVYSVTLGSLSRYPIEDVVLVRRSFKKSLVVELGVAEPRVEGATTTTFLLCVTNHRR